MGEERSGKEHVAHSVSSSCTGVARQLQAAGRDLLGPADQCEYRMRVHPGHPCPPQTHADTVSGMSVAWVVGLTVCSPLCSP